MIEPLENLRLKVELPLATITLNRPSKKNALNRATLAELEAVLHHLRGLEGVRALILTGAGEKAFAAGADIQELASLDAVAAHALSQRGNAIFQLLADMPIPVIAALNGVALGGGLELALACTIRLAAEHARLGQPEVKLGLIPGYGGTQRLARLIGSGPALEIILSGEPVSAAEALRVGLVNRVLPAVELLPAAETLARRIAANAPLAVSFCLEAVRQGLNASLEQGLALEASLFGLVCSTTDMKEGTRAFLEKRAAQFEGK
ncbi:MAG: enoyl-CoA hydratase/isomerase family protein [Terriglobales bacterium]